MAEAILRYYGAKVVLDLPYSERLVAEIKRVFARDFREWDPDKKLWTFFATEVDGRAGVDWLVDACIAEGWSVRKVFPDGQRTTIYPTGEIVSEKQEDLFR